jgi:hypothetical protein
MVKQYAVITDINLVNFEQKVEDLLKIGWQPQGGIVAVLHGTNIKYIQAMVKE